MEWANQMSTIYTAHYAGHGRWRVVGTDSYSGDPIYFNAADASRAAAEFTRAAFARRGRPPIPARPMVEHYLTPRSQLHGVKLIEPRDTAEMIVGEYVQMQRRQRAIRRMGRGMYGWGMVAAVAVLVIVGALAGVR
jgi:hypothetical protein